MKAARILLATASILAVAVAYVTLTETTEGVAFWSFPGLAVLSTLLLWSKRSGLQIAARASFASLLLFSTLAAAVAHGGEQFMGWIGIAGTSVALLAAGGIGLGARSGGFEPVAFHRSIVVALVALAISVQWLAVVGGVALDGVVTDTNQNVAMFAFACIATLGLGFFGMLRLKVWGFVLIGAACFGLVSTASALVAVAHRTDDAVALGVVAALFAVPLVAATRVLLACVTGVKKTA